MKKLLGIIIFVIVSYMPVFAQETPGNILYPNSTDTTCSLFSLSNNASSTLNGAINSSVTTITLASAANFPSCGSATIDNEVVFYKSKNSTQLLQVIRGQDGWHLLA